MTIHERAGTDADLAAIDEVRDAHVAAPLAKGPRPRAAPRTVMGVWRIPPSGDTLAPLRPMVP